jgi:hypothetical protein
LKDFYINKFKVKSDQELQKIVDDSTFYDVDAVNAAIIILNNRKNTSNPVIEKPKKILFENKSEVNDIKTSQRYNPFIRSLSYREFLTSLCLALFFLAYSEILFYYSDERMLKGLIGVLHIIGFITLVFINHIIYKLEHRRPNDFMGRSIIDVFFIITIILIKYTYTLLVEKGHSYTLNSNGIGAFVIIIFIVFLVLLFESIVSLLRIILKYVKCQIF